MDANGTRYELLLGEADWGACTDARGVPLRSLWAESAKGSAGVADGGEAGVTPDGASSARAPGADWNPDRHEVTLPERVFKFEAARDDRPPDFSQRRGAGRDRYGNWYWIDDTRLRLRVHSSGSREVTDFWPAPPSDADAASAPRAEDRGAFGPIAAEPVAPQVFAGLAVTEDHFLVAGTLAPAGLHVFDLHAGGAPLRLLWPAGVPFEPFDIARRPGGGCVVLDRRNRRVWELDRNFNVVAPSSAASGHDAAPPEAFKPLGESGEAHAGGRDRTRRLTGDMAKRLASFIRPLAVETLPDGTVLILDQQKRHRFARVHRYRRGRHLGHSVSMDILLDLIEEGKRKDFRLSAYDFAFVAFDGAAEGEEADRLYVVSPDGNQAFAFRVTWRGQDQFVLVPERAFLPMRLFGGKGLVAAGDRAHYDFGERFVPLVKQRRPRYALTGTLLTPGANADEAGGTPARFFDGGVPGCQWHRLLFDGCVPAGTRVEVRSRAADAPGELAFAEWFREPAPHLRSDGSELPFAGGIDTRGKAQAEARARGEGTWELLFQRARGRFLQLEITLRGDGRSSPRLRSMRAYYPRFSYAENYLPAVYREDEQSASFLERFLANFEGFYTTLEGRLAAVQLLFDVRSAPADALEWLGRWFGVALDPAWDDRRRRLFIRHAMHFFQYRGTRHGLELALRLAFDECLDDSAFTPEPADDRRRRARGVRLVERFRSRSRPAVEVGDPTEQSAPDVPRFVPLRADARWRPADAAESLSRSFGARFGLGEAAEFPVRNPGGEGATAWKSFARTRLGFVPQAAGADAAAWRDFLARRYRTVQALNEAHATTHAAFADVPLPQSLPRSRAPLTDWYAFESTVVAMRRTAHRFTVLLPVPRTETFGTDAQRERRELTRRIVELEKPAHTVFEIRFYWAMFRTGEARVGSDTLLDYGSRAAALAPPFVLGEEHLAEGHLAPAHPLDVEDRFVVGRG